MGPQDLHAGPLNKAIVQANQLGPLVDGPALDQRTFHQASGDFGGKADRGGLDTVAAIEEAGREFSREQRKNSQHSRHRPAE